MDDREAHARAIHNTTVAMITGDGETYWEVGREGRTIQARTESGAWLAANGLIESDYQKFRKMP